MHESCKRVLYSVSAQLIRCRRRFEKGLCHFHHVQESASVVAVQEYQEHMQKFQVEHFGKLLIAVEVST